MRIWLVGMKFLSEQWRDRWGTALVLFTPAAFVFLYWLITAGGSITYPVMVINRDQPVPGRDGQSTTAGQWVIATLPEITYPNGQSIIRGVVSDDRHQAEEALRNRDAHLLVEIPETFSRDLLAEPPRAPVVVLVGDLSDPAYAVAAVMVDFAVDKVARGITGNQPLITVEELPLGDSAARSEFENSVPGLLILAMVMLVFSVAMAVAREVEAGTLKRLQLTPMTACDFLAGISLTQILMGIATMALTFFFAWLLGFHSAGPLWAALLIGALTGLAVVGIGLIVACFATTVTKAFLVANLPFMLLMFFSGAIYPLPKVALFTFANHTVGLWDILPPTHAIVALNKILSLGVGLSGVIYELAFLLFLSGLYFALGVWLFRRTHLSPA